MLRRWIAQAYDNDPRWSGFFSYNALRVKFNDYRWTRFTPDTARAFALSGWSKNDHDMIANWYFDDAELYSQAKLQSVLDAHPWKTDRLSEDYFWQTYRGLGRNRSVWATLLVLPFFVAAIDRRTAGRRTVVLCGLTSVMMVVALTLNTKALPLRVYFPLLSFPLCVAVLMSDLRQRRLVAGVVENARESARGARGDDLAGRGPRDGGAPSGAS